MITGRNFDVVIAGGSIAGVATAAALGEFGYRILVVEPGLNSSRRLAGELIHPPGVTDLAELGLLPDPERIGGIPILGFAVFPRQGGRYLLPYAEIPGLKRWGFGIEHGVLREGLLQAAERLPHVTVWKGARVTGIELSAHDSARVTVLSGGCEVELRTKLAVAADGGCSSLRAIAGIGQRKTLISNLVGFVMKDICLPHPGYGHVFLNRAALALACEICQDTVRVMFDVPARWAGIDSLKERLGELEALPEPFRSSVRTALDTQTPLISASYCVTPQVVVKGRLVLVGDAAGCCHPLTATGMTVCTRDALRLRQALRETGGDIVNALHRYSSLRRGPQRTRFALSRTLYEAFTSQSAAMGFVRQGLLRYWSCSQRGRATSMALLCTHEARMSLLAREYLRVIWYAIRGESGFSLKTWHCASEALKDFIQAAAYVLRRG